MYQLNVLEKHLRIDIATLQTKSFIIHNIHHIKTEEQIADTLVKRSA